jgi:hypothetical protein
MTRDTTLVARAERELESTRGRDTQAENGAHAPHTGVAHE